MIAVISEDQLRNTAVISEDQLRNTAYEYIQNTSQDVEQHTTLQTLQTRDALQAAMESAEVDKIELLRAPDENHHNIIFENTDSNSQSQSNVRIFQKQGFFNALLQHLQFVYLCSRGSTSEFAPPLYIGIRKIIIKNI